MKAHDVNYETPTRSPRTVPFKVFIGYADQTALRRATTTIADAVRRSGRRVEMIPSLWRFGQLSSPRWRGPALAAALQAHAVVLACTSHSSEPDIEPWVNSLLSASRDLPITVIAVFGESDAWTITLEGGTNRANAPRNHNGQHRAGSDEAATDPRTAHVTTSSSGHPPHLSPPGSRHVVTPKRARRHAHPNRNVTH